MKYQIFAFVTMLIIGSACRQGAEKHETVNRTFRLPFIIQKTANGVVEENHADSLVQNSFKFYGKFKFTDTLDLASVVGPWDKKDFLHEYSSPKIEDTLTTDGFQLFIDYKTTILDYRLHPKYSPLESFMPVYVVNETSKTKVFIAKDSYVFGIIEAVDTAHNSWSPITHLGPDFCGNGYFGLKVHPGEFVMFLIPKFTGEQGSMRIRLMIGESLYVSSFFPGSFNPGQFYIKKNAWLHRQMKEDKHATISWEFFGAVPKEYQ